MLGDADRSIDLRLPSCEHKRGLQLREDSLADAVGRVVAHLSVQQHDELIATKARHYIGRSHSQQQAPCHFAQHLVARRVAKLIIHLLEAVQVDEQHGHRVERAAGAIERIGQAIIQ